MHSLFSELFSWLSCRFRGRVELELEVIALRHQLAVLRRQRPGCTQLFQWSSILGLKTGDAHIIRNAGGIATEDAIRSLLISHYLLGTQEFMIINHTDCGMLTFKDEELRERLERETGTAVVAPSHFHSFVDTTTNVRRQVQRVKSHPWVPNKIPVRGFVYDVRTGKLNEVKA